MASFFLPEKSRQSIHAFYKFVRMADDIADAPNMPAEQRREQILLLDNALAQHTTLEHVPEIPELYHAAERTPSLIPHARELLKAFAQDCTQVRYANWQELLDYCRHSANPVGRALLDCCGEKQADLSAADALCSALQILNHIQDMQEDFLLLDRVYLPQDWMHAAGAYDDMLKEDQMPDALMAVIAHMLTATAQLINRAEPLIRTIRTRRMRLEAAIILAVARRLHSRLCDRDPLAEKVQLSPFQYAACFIDGLGRGWRQP